MLLQKPLKILQASAGSGKTYSLTAHYLTLLFAGDTKYREILAVTFTNKATAEMKSRILEVLKGLALGHTESESFGKIIIKAHPEINPDTLKEKAEHIYRSILHDYSRFSINTIDGFVQKIIRSFSFELGLDAGFKLEMNVDKVKEELASKLNNQLDKKPELLQWIIDLALERIRDNKSWNYRDELLKLSGEIFKERFQPFEMAFRSLDADGIKAIDSSVLFKDLQEYNKAKILFVESSIKDKSKNAHDLFIKSGVLLDELKLKSKNPLSNLIKIADGDFSKIAGLKKLIDQPEEWQKGVLTSSVNQLYNQLSPVINELVNFYYQEFPEYQMVKAVDANLFYLRLMKEMAGLLSEYRDENPVLLISDAQNLLKGITKDLKDNSSFIWEKMGSRYKHFLFDEFQDTSAYQWDNFLPLLSNSIAEANGNLIDHLIVGDVKQSIYRWRNGDWRILLEKAQSDIGDIHVLQDSLAENYRSASNIIDFNNFFFKYSPKILQNKINSKVTEDGGEELFENWWKAGGYDRIIVKAYEQSHQNKAASTPAGGSIEISFIPVTNNQSRSSESKEEALDRMAITLNEWISSGRYTAGQVCILVRSNGEAREVIEHLMSDQQAREVDNMISPLGQQNWKPFQVISGEALLIANNSAVRLLLNTLYGMICKTDESTLYKANCVQLYANQLQGKVAGQTFVQLKKLSFSQLKGFLPDGLCENWLKWQSLPFVELVEKLIGAYDLNKQVIHLPYLLAFRDMASNFTKQGDRGITRFLEWWEEEGQKQALPSGEQSNAVQVMTIHKSKGLAFDVVMIPFCAWSLDGKPNSVFWVDTADSPYAMLNSLPVHYQKSLGQSAFAKAYFEELLFNYMDALNMLYVAATRTRNHLYITAPGEADSKGEQLSIAGDVIMQSLKNPISGLSAIFENSNLFVDEQVHKKEKVLVPNDYVTERFSEKSWAFKDYPLSDRINDALTDRKVWEQLELLSSDTSKRKGIILHEILARVNHENELNSVIKQMQFDGWFRQSEFIEIEQLALSVLSQPDLRLILDKPFYILSEQTIVNSEGNSYRPDKVLIGENEVIIIDFKFTGEPKPQHYNQVEEYKNLLQEMGYKNIQGYLYYGYLKELKEVTSNPLKGEN